MAELIDRQHTSTSNAALAALLPVDQPARPPGDLHTADTTSIPQGAQLFSPKTNGAVKAFLRDPFGLYTEAKLRKEEHDAETARQLANLARWNAEKTIVGGVEMTNAEAQAARQRVIDNADAYADWAITRGKLREDEREEFKQAIRRKQELEDKRGRGTLTEAEAAEERRLDRSRAGQVADDATGHAHQERGLERTVDTQRSKADDGLSQGRSANTRSVFTDYETADRQRSTSAPTASVAVAAQVKTVGLDL